MTDKFVITKQQLQNILDSFIIFQKNTKCARIPYPDWLALKDFIKNEECIYIEKLPLSVKLYNSHNQTTVYFYPLEIRNFFIEQIEYSNQNITTTPYDYITTTNASLSIPTIKKEKKEKENMFNIKGFDFGKFEGDLVKMSHLGLAIKNKAKVYVAYDKNSKEIIDVDGFNFEMADMIYKMPTAIKNIVAGDVIVHNGFPMIVIAEAAEGTSSIRAIDPYQGEEKMILPTKNMFGFNFITKIVCLFDMAGVGLGASEDSPFGNMLPLMMMSNSDSSKDNNLMTMMMLSQMNGGSFDMSNPMMLMAMMGGDSNKNDMLPMLMMSGMFNQKK